ncbi:carbamate kinase [Halanaerobium sp. ST460_2HS_T2]|uniref:carbamate kinase n=1 Tax=Halanaerobium sp. ST460_2HS_T2 TaxID=2183914 RepID=UPI000DF2DCDD|nr:carbamate kinase [Halanaerobium sp. ST460_2HS_T2]RCW62474.1 carbamate kinase [Halanaerobium sp. ST460_2HS_T2]
MSRIMLALGGNALGSSPQEQLQIVKKSASSVVDLIEQGHEVVVAHGNGPQIGMINLGMEVAAKNDERVEAMPLPESGAMSQGYIGYHLQSAIGSELRKRKISKEVATIVTQVLVDENDRSFQNPTKPIGAFYSKEQAEKLKAEKGYQMIEDSGRGYRRVVPSPKPLDIIEKKSVISLLNNDHLVITVGGGGIPVIQREGHLKGVEAVIDKDLASEKMAEIIDADFLFILTAVDRVCINFGKASEKELTEMSVEEAYNYINQDQFPAGSMLPKVKSAVKFVQSKAGRKSIIASLEKAEAALLGNSGTIVYAE